MVKEGDSTISETVAPDAIAMDEGVHPDTRQALSATRRLLHKIMRPGVRQAFLTITDQGFFGVANFLAGVMIARACTKGEYGVYVLGFTLITWATNVQASLSGTPFTVFSPSLERKDRAVYLGHTLAQHLFVSGLGAIGFLAAGSAVAVFTGGGSLAGVLLALAAASTFILLREFLRYALLAQYRFGTSLLMGLVSNATAVIVLLWAYRGGWLSAPRAYLIVGGCAGLPALVVLGYLRTQITFSKGELRAHVRKNLAFGKWLAAQVLVVFVAIRMYPWYLAGFHGEEVAGAYGACVGLANVVNPLFLGVRRFLGPRTAHAAVKGISRVRREVYLSMTLGAAPLVVAFVLAVLFGERVMVAVYGNEYAGTGIVLSVYLLAVIATVEGGIVDSGMNAVRRPDLALRARLIALAATASVGLVFAYKWGPLGAAMGVCLARFLAVAYQFMKFRRIKTIAGEGDEPDHA